GLGERHHHIGFGPSFIGEIGEARKIDHLGAIAADHPDLVHPTTPERRDLALDQWLAFELDHAFGAVAAQTAHAAAATGRENNCAHHSTLKTRRKSARSAGENGTDRSGCHIIPVIGWAEWR